MLQFRRRFFLWHTLVVFAVGLIYALCQLPAAEQFVEVRRRVDRVRTRSILTLQDSQTDPPSLHDSILQHPRLVQHCHGPAPARTLSTDVPGYRLLKASFLLAPGHLASGRHVGGLPPPPLSCRYDDYLPSLTTSKQRAFLETLDIRQHVGPALEGLKIFRQFPSSSVCSDGDLTPHGAASLIDLGDQLRDLYGDKLKVLSEIPKDNVFLGYTLPSEAVLQGSLAFLHGLLSEKQFARMYLKKGTSNFCGDKHHKLCSCLKDNPEDQEWAENYKNGYMIHKSEPMVAPNIEEMVMDSDEVRSISSKALLQFLSTWLCHKSDLPCQDGHCINVTSTSLDSLFLHVDNHSYSFSNDTFFRDLAFLQSFPFLQDVVSWLATETPGPDGMLFAGEELFMLKVLSGLGVSLRSALTPGSWMVLESYRNMALSTTAGSPVYMRLILNGEVITHEVEACHGATKHGLCKMRHLQQFLKQTVSELSVDRRIVDDKCLRNQ